jgi:histidyl-tRNA synthetase
MMKAEMYYKRNPKLLSQFQFCEEQQVPFLAILGDEELSRGEVKIRNSKTREEVGNMILTNLNSCNEEISVP